MRKYLYKEEVDISIKPKVEAQHLAREGDEITIGDLHGNFLKLLFLVVKHGIADITAENYAELVALYAAHSHILLQQSTENIRIHIARFNALLSTMTFVPGATVRLIGDEFADRGGENTEKNGQSGNDYFTLELLKKLIEHHVKIERLLSNHSAELITAVEKWLKKGTVAFTQDNFISEHINPFIQAVTLTNLGSLIDKGVLTEDRMRELVDAVYIGLKPISYTVMTDGTTVIYTHAPSEYAIVERMLKKFKLPSDKSIVNAIDRINEYFKQKHVENHTVSDLYLSEAIQAMAGNRGPSSVPPEYDPVVEDLMWRRARRRKMNDREASYDGCPVVFVHGHDLSSGTGADHIFNLDDMLGKGHGQNKGEYTVFHVPKAAIARPSPLANVKDASISDPLPSSSGVPVLRRTVSNNPFEDSTNPFEIEETVSPVMISPPFFISTLWDEDVVPKTSEVYYPKEGVIRAPGDSEDLASFNALLSIAPTGLDSQSATRTAGIFGRGCASYNADMPANNGGDSVEPDSNGLSNQ